MQTDAIHQDVSQGTSDAVSGAATDQAVLSPRELAMQEITEQINEQRETREPLVVESGAAVESAPVLPDVLAEDQLQQVKVKVKVDGVAMELPLAEVTKGYQKDAVASRRLAEAAEERKRLEALKAELAEKERQLEAQGALSTASLADDEDVDAQIAAAVAGLVEGDTDSITALLKKTLVGERQQTTPAIDAAAIAAQVKQDLEAEQAASRAQAEGDAAWNDFVASNPEFANEDSQQRRYGDFLFDSVYGPQIAAGEISYREALTKTAADVAAVFQPTQQQPSSRQQKEERKQRIDNLPIASGARAVRQAPAVESREDVLEDMRRARGQVI